LVSSGQKEHNTINGSLLAPQLTGQAESVQVGAWAGAQSSEGICHAACCGRARDSFHCFCHEASIPSANTFCSHNLLRECCQGILEHRRGKFCFLKDPEFWMSAASDRLTKAGCKSTKGHMNCTATVPGGKCSANTARPTPHGAGVHCQLAMGCSSLSIHVTRHPLNSTVLYVHC